LEGYRALDLTDEKGLFCGKILADLGADVIKIERPGGDPARNIAPFYKDIPHPERSLYWFAYNLNKRSITLNIEKAAGREIFRQLVKKADFVIETFDPGYLDDLGLGYSQLKEINPQLIMTSITPFGQTGPYKDYKGADIICWALGGMLYLCGDADRPPVQITFPQAYLNAGAEAAAATMIAFYHRQVTGEGQHIDVSIQASVTWAILSTLEYWPIMKIIYPRSSGAQRFSPVSKVIIRGIYPCRDGNVLFGIATGAAVGKFTSAVVKWMDEKGEATPFLKQQKWEEIDPYSLTQDFVNQAEEAISECFAHQTKAELYQAAMERGFLLYPVNTAKDVVDSPQLKARDYWKEVPHPELNTSIAYPGPFVRLTQTPLEIERRAPLIGEHNKEIYTQELGLSSKELVILKRNGVI